MLVIVVNRHAISKQETQYLSAAIASGTGAKPVVIRVMDTVPLRMFSLGSAPDVSVEELRAILTAQYPVKPWPQRVYEWWQYQKEARDKKRVARYQSQKCGIYVKCGHDAFLNGPNECPKCNPVESKESA